MTSRADRHRGERGSASILVLGCGLCVLLLALIAVQVGAAAEARHRAQRGADVAALAGALRAIEGEAAACHRAQRLAAYNHTRLSSCRLSGLEITVEVHASLPVALERFGSARAAARAGPGEQAAL